MGCCWKGTATILPGHLCRGVEREGSPVVDAEPRVRALATFGGRLRAIANLRFNLYGFFLRDIKMDKVQRRGLLMFMVEIDPAYEEEFNRWYNEEHLPERASCPGFQSARRFKATDGSSRYLALYDLDSPEVLDGPDYRAIQGPTEWTKRIRNCYKKVERHVFIEIFEGD